MASHRWRTAVPQLRRPPTVAHLCLRRTARRRALRRPMIPTRPTTTLPSTAHVSRLAPDPSVAASPNPTAREFDLEPADNTRLANLCGPLDENLRLLENRLNVEIRRRGGNFRIIGAAATTAEDIIHELFNIARSEAVTPERVHLTLSERDAGPAPAH